MVHLLALYPLLAMFLWSIDFSATATLIDDLNSQTFDEYMDGGSANGTLVEFY